MGGVRSAKPIDDIEIDRGHLRYFINQLKLKTKIDFDYYRENFIEQRVRFRMFSLGFTELKEYLDYFSKNLSELEIFLTKFTINTSYFFRDRVVFETIGLLFLESLKANYDLRQERRIKGVNPRDWNYINNLSSNISLPEMRLLLQHLSLHDKIQKGRHPTINIWSIPCAEGQEPYTIAMLFDTLKNCIPIFPNYKIVASDIDLTALEKAKKGIYLAEIVREVPEYLKKKYFTEIQQPLINQYQITEEIKQKVEFLQEDITQGKHKKSLRYDIILCRYFLIYIKQALQNKILRTLQKHLAPGGLLILGNPETIFHIKVNLKQVQVGEPLYTEKVV